MDSPLTDVEVRVLGSLIEKERTTPDSYPLSLNALTNACNQTSNREPVMSLDEITVSAAVDQLRRRSLVRAIVRSDARVTKYQHLLDEKYGLVQRQVAVLCVLMLRGAQTVGEIRTRTQRLHDFEDIADVESTLDGLRDREPALVVRLPLRPGQKEVRYAHLLAGEPSDEVPSAGDSARESAAPAGIAQRIAALEEEVRLLRQELTELRSDFQAFRTQFE